MIVFLKAFGLSISLICAIGAQNAYVLRQGLRGQYVWPAILTCAISDTILICTGVFAGSALEAWLPGLSRVLIWFGAAFLLAYGALSLRSAWRGGQSLEVSDAQAGGMWKVVATLLALTWLNPHVYIDTVFLIGAAALKFPGQSIEFAMGASCASFVFFIGLCHGARRLRPIFARPVAWQVLDGATGILMWYIAYVLLFVG